MIKQLAYIIDAVFDEADYDVDANGYKDYDIMPYIPEGSKAKLLLDIENELTNGADLEKLFEMQRQLQAKIDFTGIGLTQYIRLMFIGIITEACEAIEQVDWKPWKKNTGINPIASENFKEEIVDIWHFLINMTLASGMDAKELMERFNTKNKINIKRQEDKY